LVGARSHDLHYEILAAIAGRRKDQPESLIIVREILPTFQPMPVGCSPKPFSDHDWFFEVKWGWIPEVSKS